MEETNSLSKLEKANKTAEELLKRMADFLEKNSELKEQKEVNPN